MYNIIPWSNELNLEEFYKDAAARGFMNNSSQKNMIDCFKNEKHWKVWILYYNNSAVGSVAAHSFDDVMGENSFRIAARTCVFTDKLSDNYNTALRTISVITKHQNPTSQFLIPTCINWAPQNARLYITTNKNEVGTQKKVHTIFGPALERKGIMKQIKEVYYRSTNQTVWELFPDKFSDDLARYPKW
jgi:hypothetical protein